MGNSNLRVIKKKNKKEAIEGIEKLIKLSIDLDSSYDTSGLNRTLSLCSKIKAGAWGKHVELNSGGTRVSWSVSEDFKRFPYIYKRTVQRIDWNKKHYTGQKLTEWMDKAKDSFFQEVESAIEHIDSKYRAEMRDSLIDSLLDE